MSSTNTSYTATNTGTTDSTFSSTQTYATSPFYAPSTVSSTKSTSSTIKKHLISVFAKKLNLNSAPVPTKTGSSGKDGLITEEKRVRNEARASYYSTLS